MQDSNWPVFYHGISILLAGLSVLGGVTTIEAVNKVIVPILLGLVVFSFYWAIFLPYASEGITFMFSPSWGEFSCIVMLLYLDVEQHFCMNSKKLAEINLCASM